MLVKPWAANMNRLWLRNAEKLHFFDPTPHLVKLRSHEIAMALSDAPPKRKALRTNDLKPVREQREAALFCQGMSQRLGHKVYFTAQEDQDYDFIASWIVDGERHFAAVQIKEVVPAAINQQTSIEAILDGLSKYTDSDGLTVAIHLNRECRFEPSLLKVPELKIGSLWVLGSTSADQSVWTLWGNFTESQPYGTQFSYPEA